MIDPRAVIDPSANIADNVTIGAYSVIGAHVEIGEGTVIGPHVVISQHTKIGCDNHIFQFASVGEAPQDLKYAGEPTCLEIGDRNNIREFVTISRGTVHGGGVTKIGSDNLLMAYVHVGHDCQLGNHIIMANNASLAGHVSIHDHAIVGGLSAVHQFCHIGSYSICSGGSMIDKDVAPFVKAAGNWAKPYGLNTVGLRRHGFTSEQMLWLKRAYRVVFRRGLTADEILAELDVMQKECHWISYFIKAIQRSKRGLIK